MNLILLAATAIAYTNAHVIVSFNDAGCMNSVIERETGRELASSTPKPFVAIGTKAAWSVAPQTFSVGDEGRTLHYGFGESLGRVDVRVEPFAGGWSYRVVKFDVPQALVAHLGNFAFAPALAKYRGGLSNAASDDNSAACVRGYDLHGRMFIDETAMKFQIDAHYAKGCRFGFAAGPRKGFLRQLQAMTIDAGVPHTTAGGAWALDGEGARASYLKCNATENSIDRLLEVAERGGFGVVHFRERWYVRRGHYDVNPKDWPSGLAGMKRAVEKLHASGILAGLHVLTGCIDPKDPWIAGPENADLLSWHDYTLAEPLDEHATELVVAEKPIADHATVFTGSTRGNAIRIGTEIVQYTGVVREKPYRFTGLTRGAFGTRVAAHAKGEKTSYLQQMYNAFYPTPESPLAYKLVGAISNVYATCGFDQIFCDGTEGMVTTYGMAWMRHKIIGACASSGRPVLNEDSVMGTDQTWWFHSRVGAWDDTFFAPKRFTDRHVTALKHSPIRKADFLELQMGWWTPACAPQYMRAHMVDDMEYYAQKVAGLDASMSADWISVEKAPLTFHLARQMTVLGWYEHARRARAFSPETVALFDRAGIETRLRQDETGDWVVTPLVEQIHKFRAADESRWVTNLKSADVAVRLHALYSGEPYETPDCKVWLSVADVPNLKFATANSNVQFAVSAEHDAFAGDVLAVRATNAGATSHGAWAVADNIFAPPRDVGGCRVIRVRVKGDGSGAILNFQLDKPRWHGRAYSDHYVKVDFTGWREIELPVRERDAEDYDRYLWPYSADYHPVYHAWLNFGAIGALNLLVNEIPAGGKVDVKIAEVRLTPQLNFTRKAQMLTINGKSHAVPFAMANGDFAEYDHGVWTHYTGAGEPVARQIAHEPLNFVQGANEIIYTATSGLNGVSARAELDLFVRAKPRKAFCTRPAGGWGPFLAYEAVMPQLYAPKKGFSALEPIRVRPGERATVEAWVYGPSSGCSISVGSQTVRVGPVAANDRALARWTGTFTGANPVSVQTADPSLRLEFAKRYP